MFGFGRKKSQKSPAEMTAFERRQSMAMKFEMEERAKSGGSIPVAATDMIGKDMFESPSQPKKKGTVKLSEIPPPPPPVAMADRKSADPEFVEFTVVPILLRAKVSYDEANKYGETLKRLTEGEVKIILANGQSLIGDVKKCGIKTPPSFEKDILDDMYWRAGAGGNNRKSFVYYRASDAPVEGGRPKSDSSHDPLHQTKEAARQRASFSGPALPTLDESDPNRYKVRSRTKQAESLSHDLADLVSSLDALKTGGKQ